MSMASSLLDTPMNENKRSMSVFSIKACGFTGGFGGASAAPYLEAELILDVTIPTSGVFFSSASSSSILPVSSTNAVF